MAIESFNVFNGQVRLSDTIIPIGELEEDLEKYKVMIAKFKNVGKSPPIVDDRIVIAGDGDCEA